MNNNLNNSNTAAGQKKQKHSKNQYGNNRMSKKQLEAIQKKTAEESKANSYFFCSCQVCHQQVTKGQRLDQKPLQSLSQLFGKKIGFIRLIEYLLPPNEKVKGCQVLFPDTVFFANGKPVFIAKCDREGCMMMIAQPSKLALQDIRQKFSTIVRERKKETQPIVFQQSNPNGENTLIQQNNHKDAGLNNSSKLHNSPKGKASVSNNAANADEEANAKNQSNNDEKSIFYKDTAVFRFIVDETQQDQDSQAPDNPLNKIASQTFTAKNFNSSSNLKNENSDQVNNQQDLANPQIQQGENSNQNESSFQTAAVKVVRDTEFINEFRRRANDEFWKTIDCIQTSVKAKTGIGHPIFIHFLAPIPEDNTHNQSSHHGQKKDQHLVGGVLPKDIDYSGFKTMADDADLIRQEEDELYAYKQCLKIAYYVSKVHNQEILQMKAEFLKDENSNIWFFYASNINIRSKARVNHGFSIKNSASQKANEQKEQLIAEIEQYEQEQAAAAQNKSIGRMLNMMDSYYFSMKEEMGIMEKHDDYAEEDHKLDEVLKTLRPNTTANNFKHFLARQENITRPTHWKAIARGLDTNKNTATDLARRNNPNNKSMIVSSDKASASNFMNKRVYSQDQRKNMQIQSLISALNQSTLNQSLQNQPNVKNMPIDSQIFVGNSRDSKARELMKRLSNLNRSTNFSQENNQSLAINQSLLAEQAALNYSSNQVIPQKSINLLGQTSRQLFQYSGPYGSNNDHLNKRDQRSNFKAELVRNELLSRSDLMKLYQPPLKKSQLPTNNPFYTKTIVQTGQSNGFQINLSQFRGNIIQQQDKPYLDQNHESLIDDARTQLTNSYFNTAQTAQKPQQYSQQQYATNISTQFNYSQNSSPQQPQLQNYNLYQQQQHNVSSNQSHVTTQRRQANPKTGVFNSTAGHRQIMQEDIINGATDLQSIKSQSLNGQSTQYNQSHKLNNHQDQNNNQTQNKANAEVVVNWSSYSGTQKLAKQITKRMEYLKLTESFAGPESSLPQHQEI